MSEGSIVCKAYNEVKKEIIGQEDMLRAISIGILTNSHVLLEGSPGTAKTRTVRLFADHLGLISKRIQFTPDIQPSDIIGADLINFDTGDFEFKKGRAFTHFLLADELNRAPSRIQSALLEVMEEKNITPPGRSSMRPLPDEEARDDRKSYYNSEIVFCLIGTLNPIEQEGVFTLPEALLDRFSLKVEIHYPSKEKMGKILEFDILDNIKWEAFWKAYPNEKEYKMKIKTLYEYLEHAKIQTLNENILKEINEIIVAIKKLLDLQPDASLYKSEIDLLKKYNVNPVEFVKIICEKHHKNEIDLTEDEDSRKRLSNTLSSKFHTFACSLLEDKHKDFCRYFSHQLSLHGYRESIRNLKDNFQHLISNYNDNIVEVLESIEKLKERKDLVRVMSELPAMNISKRTPSDNLITIGRYEFASDKDFQYFKWLHEITQEFAKEEDRIPDFYTGAVFFGRR